MRSLLFVLFFFVATCAHATTYYIAANGNATNNGTSTSTPWSLDKLNASWASILAGDQILFQKGDVFNGGIVIGKSGTATAKITIGTYGAASAKPVISGLVTATGWVSKGNGIYESTTTTPVDLRTVLVNNKVTGQGRTPNAGSYYTSSTGGSTTTVTSNMPTTTNWTGATLGARVSHWQIGRYTITGQSGSTLTIANGKTVASGYGLWIMNDIRTLDQLGEWYRDPATGKLSMFFGTASPSSYKVEMSTISNLILSTSKSYITIDGLALKGSNDNAVDINSGTDITVTNCDIDASGGSGVDTKDHTNFTVNASRITRSLNNGLHLNMYSTGENIKATNNYIDSSFFIEGMGGGGQQDGNGITLGRTGLVEGNTIKNTGYCGIRFSAFLCTIRNNYIDTFCFIKDDGGGIYTGGNNPYAATPKKSLIGNMLFHGIGAPKGTPDVDNRGEGIYMDDDANNIDIIGNTVAYASKGLFIHNNSDVNIHDNTFFSNLQNMYYKDDNLGEIHITGINATRNMSFGLTTGNRVVYAANTTSTVSAGTMGIIDSNYYCRPIDEALATPGKPLTWRESTETNVTFSGWKSKYPNYDKATKITAKTIASTSEVRFEYNPTPSTVNVSLNSKTYIDPTGVAYNSGTLQLAPYASKILLYTGVVSATTPNSPPTATLTSPKNNATFFSPATITLTATATDVDGTVKKVVFYRGAIAIDSVTTAPYTVTWNNVPNGTYALTAKATDDKGAVGVSLVSSITVSNAPPPNKAPTVSIVSPANKSTFTAPASIQIQATATDSDGTVKKVEFYNGAKLIDSVTTAPYNLTWNSVGVGTYSVTAKAYDNAGAVTTSKADTLIVNAIPNKLPTIKISSPLNNTAFSSPATVPLKVVATDSDGVVKKVEYYNGATLIDSVKIAPFDYTWSGVATGTYVLRAKAYDDLGGTATSATDTIVVSTRIIPPTVSLVLPTADTTAYSTSTIFLQATAADADGTVKKVEFYAGSTLIGTDTTSPYTYSWKPATTGTYSVTAKATDNVGAFTTSNIRTITIITAPAVNKKPSVSLTSPLNKASYYSPASVPLSANASDLDGTVKKVEFYNGSTIIATDTSSPYAFAWNNVPNGTYVITARAYDNAGGDSISAGASITVVSPPPPNIKPTVSLTSPANNSSYYSPTSISLTATASDADGAIKRVEFYSGSTLLSTDTAAPYAYVWDNVPNGSYSLTARAYDDSNAVTMSAAAAIIVSSPPPANVPPSVSLTSPVNNANYFSPATIQLTATATDVDGTISKVEFYNGSTLITTEKIFPYDWTWNNVPNGTYAITAKAYDNSGAVTISSVSTIIVKTAPPRNVAPLVALTSPTNNASYFSPAKIQLTATATDNDGTITKVEFYRGTTLITTEKLFPYDWTWNNVPNGTYAITARAYDDSGAVSISGVSTITVVSPPPVNKLPKVTLTSPVDGSAYYSPATFAIAATASDSDGTISKVEFYRDTTLIRSLTVAPYTITLNSLPDGIYNISAKAYDNSGAVVTSATSTVTVTTYNALPTVSLTSPAPNLSVYAPASFMLAAVASDSDGTISKVEFYSNNTLLQTVAQAPYQYQWNSVGFGTYALTAKAYDNRGGTRVSAAVNVIVSTAPVNPPGDTNPPPTAPDVLPIQIPKKIKGKVI